MRIFRMETPLVRAITRQVDVDDAHQEVTQDRVLTRDQTRVWVVVREHVRLKGGGHHKRRHPFRINPPGMYHVTRTCLLLCLSGFSSPLCQTYLEDCLSNQCLNGATCRSLDIRDRWPDPDTRRRSDPGWTDSRPDRSNRADSRSQRDIKWDTCESRGTYPGD